MSTARVLQALGYPTMASGQAEGTLERQAEEGTVCGNCSRTASVLDMADDFERRGNPGLALSTVASMSEMHSPVRQVTSPTDKTI